MGKHSIETSIDLPGSSPAAVWSVFSRWEGWGSWSTFLEVQQPPTSVGHSMRIRCKPRSGSPMVFTPQVLALEPEKELRWRGKLWNSDLFFVGEHYFRFEPLDKSKGTRLVHGEKFEGLLVPLMGGMLRNTEKEFEGFNEQLRSKLADASSSDK